MDRAEAQITAGKEVKHFRPLSLGTMAILQELHNTTLAALLGGGSIAVNYEDFVIFLFVHARKNTLGQIKEMILDGKLVQNALDWVDEVEPIIIAEGTDYFCDTQTRAQLVSATTVKSSDEKKLGAA